MTESSVDYTAWRIGFDIAQFAITGLVWLYVFLSNRSRVKAEEIAQYKSDTNRRIEEHKKVTDKHIDAHSMRLSTIEETVRCGPSHDDIGKVHGRLDTVSEQLSQARGELKGISRSVDLIHQFLLNQKQKDGSS